MKVSPTKQSNDLDELMEPETPTRSIKQRKRCDSPKSTKSGFSAMTKSVKSTSFVNVKAKENFESALKMCEKAIEVGEKNNDIELLIDCWNLKAVIHYRLDQALKAVKAFKTARRTKANFLNNQMEKDQEQNWENQFADYNVIEIGQDFQTTDFDKNLKKVHRSDSFEHVKSRRLKDHVHVFKLERRKSQT